MSKSMGLLSSRRSSNATIHSLGGAKSLGGGNDEPCHRVVVAAATLDCTTQRGGVFAGHRVRTDSIVIVRGNVVGDDVVVVDNDGVVVVGDGDKVWWVVLPLPSSSWSGLVVVLAMVSRCFGSCNGDRKRGFSRGVEKGSKRCVANDKISIVASKRPNGPPAPAAASVFIFLCELL